MTYRSPTTGHVMGFTGWFAAHLALLGESIFSVFATLDTAAWNSALLLISSGICLMLTQVGPALVKFLRENGPELLKFIGDARKMLNETKQLATENKARLDVKDDADSAMRDENAQLKAQLAALQGTVNAQDQKSSKLESDVVEMSQAGLVMNGDMKDPIKERTGK